MSIVIFLIVTVMGVLGSFTGTQERARDTERKTDINAIHSQLEVFYAQNGYYPTTNTFNSEADALLRGLDNDVFVDPDGKRINTSGDYSYVAHDCDGSQCRGYDLTADMEAEDRYLKTSLN